MGGRNIIAAAKTLKRCSEKYQMNSLEAIVQAEWQKFAFKGRLKWQADWRRSLPQALWKKGWSWSEPVAL